MGVFAMLNARCFSRTAVDSPLGATEARRSFPPLASSALGSVLEPRLDFRRLPLLFLRAAGSGSAAGELAAEPAVYESASS